jgi:hypothetical protein
MQIEHIAGTGASVATLNSGFTFVFDTADTPRVTAHKWRKHSKGYVTSHTAGYLHRFISGTPSNLLCDHRNLDKSDCRSANLRHATLGQNMANRPVLASSATGLKGVIPWPNGKFRAALTSNGVFRHIGFFSTAEAAHGAYVAAATKYHGEFARA